MMNIEPKSPNQQKRPALLWRKSGQTSKEFKIRIAQVGNLRHTWKLFACASLLPRRVALESELGLVIVLNIVRVSKLG